MDITKTISSTNSLRSSTMDSLPMDDAFMASRREEKWLSNLMPLLASTEQRLWMLWERHDFDGELRERRKRTSEELVSNLLEDMVRQEEKMGDKLSEEIRVGRRKVNDMRSQLGLPHFNESAYPPESVRLWRLLDAESKSLAKQLEDLEARVPQLEARLAELRRRLGEERRVIKKEEEVDKENLLSSSSSIYSNPLLPLMEGLRETGERGGGASTDEEKSPVEKECDRVMLCKRVARLEARCVRLTRELEDRKERVRVAQFEIRERTGRIGDAQLLSDVADIISLSIDSLDTILTMQRVERAEQAREVVSFKYREWAEREAFAYDELYLQLHELWDACHIPDRERALPKRFLPEKHSHAEVERARGEVERLTVMREERKAVHEAIEKWTKLWSEKVHFEQETELKAETGVSKYANRAGTLLKAMKRANQLEKVLLPGAAICVQSTGEEYAARHGGEQCRIHGMTPLEYIDFVKAEHAREKEERRAERVAARKAGLAGTTSASNMTKSPWMPGGRSASRLVPTAFSTTRLPTTPYAGGVSSSRVAGLSRAVAASASVLHGGGTMRSPLTPRAPTTPSNMHTPSRSKFTAPSASTHHLLHTPSHNTSVLSGRVRKSFSKGKGMSPKRFLTPILSALSPIASSRRPTASPLSMTSSSGVSSARPSTAASGAAPSPAPYRAVPAPRLGAFATYTRLPPPTSRTPLASSLGTLPRTPRFHL
ncbi:hypothetical protein PFISCL1PPCAC_3131 [Pristionchus fissidentatus]|uniref:Uncharacterized protein n=1 Tax=Pristionchus fissidentatus TaxID=1538716 RepID=A0AAV5UZS5_9BILA|nr:hypothetical protein PFISCL1PPCAC_3131 [Pristionchus fissidentatus]